MDTFSGKEADWVIAATQKLSGPAQWKAVLNNLDLEPGYFKPLGEYTYADLTEALLDQSWFAGIELEEIKRAFRGTARSKGSQKRKSDNGSSPLSFTEGAMDELFGFTSEAIDIVSLPDPLGVFVSYSRADAQEVYCIVTEALEIEEKPSLDLWIDRTHMRPGFPWPSQLEQAIKETHCVLTMIGASGLGNTQENEVLVALKRNREGLPVIPVLLPSLSAESQLPLTLEKYHSLDLRTISHGQRGFVVRKGILKSLTDD